MANQFLKLRRSAVPGRIPSTSSLDFGEIALNTYDGLAFIKKSGSYGEEIVTIGASNINGKEQYVAVFSGPNSIVTGSILDIGSSVIIGYSGSLSNSAKLFISSSNTPNLLSAETNFNSRAQISIRNYSGGAFASSNFTAYADDSTNADTRQVSLGINNSNYNDSSYIGEYGDGFVYSSGNDFYIGNTRPGKRTILFSGGADAVTNARVFIHEQGTISINTSNYDTVNPASLWIQAPNSTTYNIVQARSNVNNYAQVGIVNANSGVSASSDLALYNNVDPDGQLTGYVDIGINSTNYALADFPGGPGDAYVFSDANHLHLGSINNTYPVTLFAGGVDVEANQKLALYPNNQHIMSGSLDVSGSITAQSFTGSFKGDGSGLYNISFIATGSITASVGPDFGNAFKVQNNIPDPFGNTTLLLVSNSGSVALNTGSFEFANPETLLIVSHDDTSYNLIVGRSNTDNYSQFNIKNSSSGTLASSDVVATTNDGDENQGYIDMGINSSNYFNPYFVGRARDAYLYSTGDDLWIGNASANKKVGIFSGGPDSEANAKIFIHPEGVISVNTVTTSSTTSPALPALRIVASPSAPNTYNLLQAESNVDTYSQILIQNLSSGTSASADIVAENDLGTETSYYVDMGINSSTHVVDPSYTVGGPNDTYLLSTGRNHYIGSATTGSLIFFTNTDFNGETGAKLILNYNNAHKLTGSLDVSGSITSSLFGTASWAQNSLTASYWSGSIINVLSSSFASTASFWSGSIINALSSSFALTASSADNFTVRGTLTAQTIVVQTITASTEIVTGSTQFGSIITNTHQFTGSVSISGSLNVNGNSVVTSNQTGSMSVATASFASTASYVVLAQTASYWSGSILNATSASFASTASYWSGSINNALSASYAATASYVVNALSASYWSGSITNALSASFASTASYWSGSILNSTSASFASTASYVVNAISASYWSGSITNALSASFASTASFWSGSIINALSSSYALTASFALNAGAGAGFPFSGSAVITGSLLVTNGITGSLFGTSSWATNALTASYVLASGVVGLNLSQITTGSVTASVNVNTASFTLVSSSNTFLFVSSSGNVGIGTSTPLFRLDTSGSFRTFGNITATSGSSYFVVSQSITQPAQTGSQIVSVNITPSFTYTAPLQTQTAFRVAANFSGSAALTSSQTNIIADIGATSVGSQFIINDITSGSIYMVNDASGLPIIEANSNWDVFMYDYPKTIFKKTGSMLELGAQGDTSSFTQFRSDLIINEGLGFTYRQAQASGSTNGAVTASLFNITFTNVSSSVFVHAVVTGYDTGSRDTITGEVRSTIRYRAGVASVVGTNFSFANSDASIVNFDIIAGSTSSSLVAYGTGSRVYQWGATVTTQII